MTSFTKVYFGILDGKFIILLIYIPSVLFKTKLSFSSNLFSSIFLSLFSLLVLIIYV